MKTKDVKVQKVQMKRANAVNVIITLPNGKIVDLSFGDGEFCMIHHTTTVNRILFRPLDNVSKVTKTNENGTVREVSFNGRDEE